MQTNYAGVVLVLSLALSLFCVPWRRVPVSSSVPPTNRLAGSPRLSLSLSFSPPLRSSPPPPPSNGLRSVEATPPARSTRPTMRYLSAALPPPGNLTPGVFHPSFRPPLSRPPHHPRSSGVLATMPGQIPSFVTHSSRDAPFSSCTCRIIRR